MGFLKVTSLLAIWLSVFLQSESSFAQGKNDSLYVSEQSPVISFIESAKKTIDIEIYTMKDLKVLGALKSAMDRGIKLRIIQTSNPFRDSCTVFTPPSGDAACDPLRDFVKYVRDHGGTYLPFSDQLCGTPGSLCFQHGKLLMIDSKLALVSSGNFDATNLCDVSQSPSVCNRDFSITTTNPNIVQTLKAIFEKDLLGKTYDLSSILDASAAQRVTASPLSLDPLIKFIQSAKKTIQIENQYLNEPTINQALIEASGRGVKVFLMVASVCAFGPPKTQGEIDSWTQKFTAFDQAKIHTRMFDKAIQVGGLPGYLHAKAILVDGIHAWVGSVNGSTQSVTNNREFGIFSDDASVVNILKRTLTQDFGSRDGETWKQSLKCMKDAAPKKATSSEN